MKPELGVSPSDRRARLALGRRIASELLQGEQIPDHGHYPALGERWNRPRSQAIGLLIPVNSFRRITEKVVRGVTYSESRQFIEPPHQIEFFAVEDNASVDLRKLLEQHGTTIAREPGIVVKRAVAPEDGISSLFEIELWKQFKTYASVLSDA